MTAILVFIRDRYLVLPLGAAIAIVWANVAGESYFRVAQTLAFPVNDIAMAFFFALIAQEVVEAVMPGGALHSWRRWALPLAAAAGGAAGAVGTYLAWTAWQHEAVLSAAWPIVAAIDMVAGYYVLRLIKPRQGALPFLLAAGIVTNAAGLLLLAAAPRQAALRVEGALLFAAALAIAALLRHRRVNRIWIYFAAAGPLSWWGLYLFGVHPALALVPVVAFLPHEPRRGNIFAEPADDDEVHHEEREWALGVQAVLFLFGLTNAGVPLHEYDTGTWAFLAGALAGRPLGMLAATALGVAAGLRLPGRTGWRDLTVTALASSSGFTFALVAAATLLPIGAVLTQIKVGALATVAGALVTAVAAMLLGVGRFSRRRTRRVAAAPLLEDARGISAQAR